MIEIAFLRHGATAWNQAKRLQGRTDEPLLEQTEQQLRKLCLPPELASFAVVTSPLRRAIMTAEALRLSDYQIEPRLIEMSYGAFEGRTLADLRTELGDGLNTNEARGLDFLPPGGESPREVQIRLKDWLDQLAQSKRNVLAITHKGIIRCILTLAFGWDMTGKQPVKLDWSAVHLFQLYPDGSLKPHHLNLPLCIR